MSFGQVVKGCVSVCDQLERRRAPERGETVVVLSLQQIAIVAELFHRRAQLRGVMLVRYFLTDVNQPARGAKCCDKRVCLSVCPLAYLKKFRTFKLLEIFCTRYRGPWLGPPLTTMEYAIYFRFLWKTSRFP